MQTTMSLTINEPVPVDDDVVIEYPVYYHDSQEEQTPSCRADNSCWLHHPNYPKRPNELFDQFDAMNCSGRNIFDMYSRRRLPPYPVTKVVRLPKPSHPSASASYKLNQHNQHNQHNKAHQPKQAHQVNAYTEIVNKPRAPLVRVPNQTLNELD